jgi:molybdopterin converting factor small subunit
VRFVLSGNLLRFSSFGREVSIDAPTLSDGLSRLCEQCPSLRPVLLDGDGKFRQIHRLFVNGDQVMVGELGAPRGAGDEVQIVTAFAGG